MGLARLRRERWTSLALGVLAVSLPLEARADGLDAAWYLSRVPGWHHAPLTAVVLLAVLMVLNYGLNYVVLGLPAIRMGGRGETVVKDLIGFTLFGQVADRLGAIVGPLLGSLAGLAFGMDGRKSLGLSFSVGFVLNFVLSGVVIALLARWYMQRRWSLAGRKVNVQAVITGVLTNPLWAVALVNALAG